MKILVTNDDGIDSPGLWTLVEELSKVGEVAVYAPDREQSGIGTAITLHKPVRLVPIDAPLAGVSAFGVEGTPGDSVILGLDAEDGVGMVVSGINRGANMGSDILLSGTVGGALQGYLHGLPSIAVSVQWAGDVRFDVAARLGGLLARRIFGRGAGRAMLLNVNLPNLALESIKGVAVTRVGRGGYSNAIGLGYDGTTDNYRIAIGQPSWSLAKGTDVHAVETAQISITPLEGMFRTARAVPFLNGAISYLFEELRG